MVFEIIFPDPLLKVELRLALATYDVEGLRKIKKLENVKVNLTLQQLLKKNPLLSYLLSESKLYSVSSNASKL